MGGSSFGFDHRHLASAAGAKRYFPRGEPVYLLDIHFVFDLCRFYFYGRLVLSSVAGGGCIDVRATQARTDQLKTLPNQRAPAEPVDRSSFSR